MPARITLRGLTFEAELPMKPHLPRPVLVVLAIAALAACSQQNDQSAADAARQQAQAQAAEAAKQLDNYRQLVRIHNDEMAVAMGHTILERYPGSAAAQEVQQSLPGIEARYKADLEKRRLAALWLYQVSPMAGGTQSTASLNSLLPSGNNAIRLVLRRHNQWGQSVFLFGTGHGFSCKGTICTIPATFDGKPHPLKAYLPQTGEPAIFIKDDDAFIAALAKTGKIDMQPTLKDGGQQEVIFETGGFDASKWAAVPKGKKK